MDKKKYLINKLKELTKVYKTKHDDLLRAFIGGQAAMCGFLLTEFFGENHDDIFFRGIRNEGR